MARSRSKKEKSPSIAGTDWVTLDFGQIEKALAAKLSDEDARDVLLHINAANKLKILLLTNCTNITGSGLSPLSESTTIEQIDLGIAEKFQSPRALSAIGRISFSCEIVLPILNSIISNGALCKLKYLHCPYVWRFRALQMRGNKKVSTLERMEAQLASEGVDTGSSTESDFHAFLVRYNQMLENRGPVSCLKCNEVTPPYHQPRIALDNRHYDFCTRYGTQRNFCHQCSNYACGSFRCNVDHHFCIACEREYCAKCVTMEGCGVCGDMCCVESCLANYHCCANSDCDVKLCDKCKVYSACIKCDRTWCTVNCYVDCPTCEGCQKRCCIECSEGDKASEVLYCDDCNEGYYCSTCLLDEALQEGKLDCQSCMKRVTPLILKQNKQLKDENKELKDVYKELKNANEELKSANIGLKQMQMNQSKLIQDLRGSKQNP
jgi:FtsZ-binding cell division protein ZapB